MAARGSALSSAFYAAKRDEVVSNGQAIIEIGERCLNALPAFATSAARIYLRGRMLSAYFLMLNFLSNDGSTTGDDLEAQLARSEALMATEQCDESDIMKAGPMYDSARKILSEIILTDLSALSKMKAEALDDYGPLNGLADDVSACGSKLGLQSP